MPRLSLFAAWLALGFFLGSSSNTVHAAPFVPKADQDVLEKLPARAAEPRMRELSELRSRLQTDPRNLDVAIQLARRYFEEVEAEGDPRYVGYAEAALAPWWKEANAPIPVRVMRAILLQFNHHFDEALADLTSVVQQEPTHGEAWSWITAIRLVQGNYEGARQACSQAAPYATPLIAAACKAQVDSLTGQAASAASALQTALAQHGTQADVAEQLWVLTRLAEIQERRGEYGEAEAAYRRALALGLPDGYLLGAYADFLIDRGRFAETLALLKDKSRSDLLLLRLAIAAKASNAASSANYQNDLAARFEAARLRGDTSHQKEEARFALSIQGQAGKALALARENYRVQREPADARVLLEAAIAAKDPNAAEPVLKWLADTRIESTVLSALTNQLKGIR